MPKPRAQGLGLATSSEAMAVSLTAVQRPGKLHAFQFQISLVVDLEESRILVIVSRFTRFLDSRFRFQIQINGRTLQWLGQAHVCLCLCLFVRAQVDTATWSRGRCVCRMRMCLILVKQQDWLRSWTSFEFKFLARSRTNLYVHTGLDSRLT